MEGNVTINTGNKYKGKILIGLLVLLVLGVVGVASYFATMQNSPSSASADEEVPVAIEYTGEESPYTPEQYKAEMETHYVEAISQSEAINDTLDNWSGSNPEAVASIETHSANLSDLMSRVGGKIPPREFGSAHREFVTSLAYMSNGLKELYLEIEEEGVRLERARYEMTVARETLDTAYQEISSQNLQ